MADLRALRNTRLTNEHKELMKINGPVIVIEPLGSPPYDKYRITYNIRTIVSPKPTYRNSTVCTLSIPPSYPGPTGAPSIYANETPYPWHINWFQSGKWCSAYYTNNYDSSESLVNFVLRCARVLQFDPEIANRRSVANHDAEAFWDANVRNKRVMPCDTTPLPVLGGTGSITFIEKPQPRITFIQTEKPKISILPRD